ncbi:major facilitator superfamily domain-containing protein [Aspergillus alliaceus]|uniref:Major facilitator superfamily domain-containing protein n=1 Tax=Petromyces alliaceus TaxID=209559 RepID=A0A5N7BU06_PETAA|nr:major facilitator superfamily domain-containing protein [Aspergillus alliaceus]
MASAVTTAANVPRSRSLRGEDAMTIDVSTNHFGNALVVMDDFAKPDHSTPYSPTKGSCHDPDVLIVNWDGPDDPQDPFNWSVGKKWWTVGLGLLASFICSMNGSILSVAHRSISEEFGISDGPFPNSYWITTSWGVGAAIFPLILFPLIEDWGVRPVVLGTYFCFMCLLIPIGLAQNFATLVAVRFFTGGCVPLMSDAVASITSNVFHGDRARSVPVCLYVMVYLGATSLGPVIGASILQFQDWRWIGYVELIFTVAVFPFLFLGLHETRGLAILRAKAKRMRKEGKKAYTAEESDHTPLHQALMRSVQRPIYMFFTESVVFVATIWAAFSLGTIYVFTQSVGQVYGQLYGWNAVQVGYVQSAIVIGEILGTGLSLSTNRWYYASAARNTESPGTPIPEARLYPAIIGGLFGVTGGMLVYGWAAYPNIYWVVTTVGLIMVGFGTTAVVISIANYLIDAYSKYAASALAAVGLLENASIAFLPLAASAMYTHLGFHWASTLLGLVSLSLVATPFLVIKWGKEIRARSPFMKEAIIARQGNLGAIASV